MSARRIYTRKKKKKKLNFVAAKTTRRTKYTRTNQDRYDSSYVEHASVMSTILTGLQISQYQYLNDLTAQWLAPCQCVRSGDRKLPLFSHTLFPGRIAILGSV